MKTLTLILPDSLDIDEQEAKCLLAAKLYEKGSLSLGQAADLAGYSKRTFMELLGKHQIPLFNLTEKELDQDILNAKNYHI
jgi:predicted HTH domain antitoxin